MAAVPDRLDDSTELDQLPVKPLRLLKGAHASAHRPWPAAAARTPADWPVWSAAATALALDPPPVPPPTPVAVPRGRTDVTRFERVETKYCVPSDVAERVMRLAQEFLEPDANQAVPGFQRITSLYLDTRDLLFLRWTRERRSSRFKLRVRAYGDGAPTAVYAEVKSKVQGIVQKQRAMLRDPSLAGLQEGPSLADPAHPDEDGPLQEFVWRSRRFGAEPRLLIRCDRLALRGSFPGDETAVTVDRRLEYQPSSTLVGEPWAWQPVRLPRRVGADGVVLEFKHARQVPIWMAVLEQRLGPWRRSFSKYGTAMSQLSPWECP